MASCFIIECPISKRKLYLSKGYSGHPFDSIVLLLFISGACLPAAAYYSIGSRAFELLVGCSIALTDVKQVRYRWFNSLMSAFSLLMIVVTAVVFNKNSPFPVIWL